MKRLVVILFFIALFFQAKSAFSMGMRPRRYDYNLLLITIDTLRPDHLGCYGYQGIKTPYLDTLASQGVIFTEAFTPVPITLPSHASIMTGQYPIQHGVRNNGSFVLSEEATTLAEVMRDKGYQTGACIGAFVLDSVFGLNQGFNFYDDRLPAHGKQTNILYNERRAEDITRLGLKWLTENREKRFFLWLHYFDPHAAYSPPSPFALEYQKCPYDGEIAYTDKCLGDLLEGMERMGLTNQTIIILTADHGESLGEHGEATHAIFIYDSTLRIPLIIKGPDGLFPRGKSIQAMVSNMDIFSTVLDLFGLGKIPDLADKSLLPLIYGKTKEIRQELLCESLCPELNFGWSRLEGLRKVDWKYIQAPWPEIYHLTRDPLEGENLIDKDKGKGKNQEICLQWKKDLERLKQNYSLYHQAGKQIQMNREVQERLRSLGYVWTGPGDKKVNEARDPKDMIYLVDYLDKGIAYLSAHLYDQSILYFQNIIQVNPDNVAAHFNLGRAYQEKNILDQAEVEFKKALSLDPHQLDIHNQLGLIHYQRGDFDLALAEFKLAVAWTDYPEIHYNLSLAYNKKGKTDESLAAIEEALHLDPNYAEAHNQAGNLFFSQENLEKAVIHFETAIKIDPGNSSACNNLGLIYNSQGKSELARQQFQQAILLDPDNPEAHNNLGSIYLNQGLFQEGMVELKKAISLKPGYKNAMINLGRAYFGLRDYTLAEQGYQRVIELDRDYAESYNQLGLLYLDRGDFTRASSSFQDVVRLQPSDPLAYYYLGKAEYGLQRIDEAIQAWEKALCLKPDLGGAHLNLGNAYFEKNLIDKAIEEWRIALSGKGIDLFSHLMNLGLTFSQMGEDDKAIKAWQKARDLEPESPNPYYCLGISYFRKGLLQPARDELIESLRLQPDNQSARSLLEKIEENW